MSATQFYNPFRKIRLRGTIEFYTAFWPLIRKYLVDSINYSYEFGELSSSPKPAIITLIEKKRKDKRMIKTGVLFR